MQELGRSGGGECLSGVCEKVTVSGSSLWSAGGWLQEANVPMEREQRSLFRGLQPHGERWAVVNVNKGISLHGLGAGGEVCRGAGWEEHQAGP